MRNRFVTIDWGVRFISVFSILVGAYWLAQWFSGIAAQRSVTEIVPKTNMALSMFVGGLSLFLLQAERPAIARRAFGALLAAIVFAVGTLTLAEHFFNVDFGFDQLLASELPGAPATASPNRLGPPGALSLSLIGAGLLAAGLRRRALASGLGIAVMAVAMVPVFGFLYGIQAFYSIPNYTGIALPTVSVMLALGFGLILLHPDGGLVGLMRRNDAGGDIFRRLFPAGVLMVILLGFLQLLIRNWGLLGSEATEGLLLVLFVVFYTSGVWFSATHLSSSEKANEQAQEALCESEQRYRGIVETAEEGIAIHLPDGTITYVNNRMAELLGYSRDEIIGRSSLDFVDDEEREAVIAARDSIEGKGSFSKERKLRRKDGSTLWTLANVAPQRDDAGHFLGYLAMHTDITERKKMEAALRESEAKANALVKYAPTGIYEVDLRGPRLVSVNDAMCQVLGYSREELLAMDPIVLLDNEGRTLFAARAQRQLAGEHPSDTVEYRIRKKDGALLDALLDITFNIGGNPWRAMVVAHDITERKRAEEALKIKDNAIASSLNAIAIADLEGFLTYVNAAFLRLWGYQDEHEVQGKSALDFWEDPAQAQDVMAAIESRQNWIGELTAKTKNGRILEVEVSASIVSDNAGNPICMMAAFLDVTERKRAEAALRESEAKANALVKFAPTGIYEVDFRGPRFLSVNDVICEILGYTREELLAMDPTTLLDEEGRGLFDDRVRRQLTGEQLTDTVEYRIRKKDGSMLDVLLDITFNIGGDPCRAMVVAHDITERKRAEEALRESEAKLKSLADNVPCVLMRFDRQLRILYLNPQSELYNPIPVERLIGRTNREAGMPVELCDLWDAAIERVFSTGTQQEMEFNFAGPSGVRTFALKFAPEFGPNNQVEYVLGVSSDITERKTAEEELKRLVVELARSNKDLEQYAYISSHDLQEPLRQVTSFVDLLEKEYSSLFDDEAKTFMGFITEGTSRMSMLIRDLLTYSRVGRGEKLPEQVNMSHLMQQTLNTLRLRIQEANANITIGELPTVEGSPVALAQLLQNLVGNSLKFRGQAHPEIVVGCRREGADWLFSIQDNGIGFSSEFRETIFEIFRRLHSRKEYEGTGIGLSICRRVVELHDGRIWAESELGKGSTFYFTLPAQG